MKLRRKTELEQAIRRRAEERVAQEVEAYGNLGRNNKIFDRLKVIGTKSEANVNKLARKDGYYDYSGITNINQVKKDLLEQFIKEETRTVLDKLDSINYLLEMGQHVR